MSLRLCLVAAMCFLCSGGEGQQVDNETRYVNVLKEFRNATFGQEFEIESHLNITRDPGKKPRVSTISVSEDGTVIRKHITSTHISRGIRRYSERWTYQTPIFEFTRARSWNDQEERPISFTAVSLNNTYGNSFFPCHALFAFDADARMYWGEIAANPKSDLRLDGGNASPRLEIRLADIGHYVFYFAEDEHGIYITRSVISKQSGDLAISPYIEKLQFGPEEERKRTAVIEDWDQFQYQFVDGRRMVKEVTSSKAEDFFGAPSRQTKHKFIVTSIKPTSSNLGSRIAFPEVEIPNGTEVRVVNDKNIPYEFRGGNIVKVVIPSAIVSTEEARFREPKSTEAWWWYMSLGFGLALVVVFFIIVRARGR